MSCPAHRWVDTVLGEQMINLTINSMIRFFFCCDFIFFCCSYKWQMFFCYKWQKQMRNAVYTHTHTLYTHISVVRKVKVFAVDTNMNSGPEGASQSLCNVSNDVLSWTCSNRAIKEQKSENEIHAWFKYNCCVQERNQCKESSSDRTMK